MKIDQDHSRFKKIVRGKIAKNLKRFITNGELIGRQGKGKISIPIKQINIPRFKFNDQQMGGVGQGDGDIGDSIGQDPSDSGSGQAGKDQGDHSIEVDITLDELADILGEELKLPNIEPKGNKNINETQNKYTGVRQTGPEGLKHFKRTFKESLKRQMVTGVYNPNDPVILPHTSDKRFKSFKQTNKPKAQAVILYLMDVSGSMGEEQKDIVRTESFWLDTWLSKQYKGLETRFIIHDSSAKEVDRETFFTTKESGGTIISSAYKLCKSIIERDYASSEWNSYIYQFSDGDNWSIDDNNYCVDLIRKFFIPHTNQFGYGQVESQYGSGGFINTLRPEFKDEPKVVLSEISGREDIIKSIKEFLGTGN